MALPLGLGEASVEKYVADEANYKMSYPIVYVDRNQEVQDRINSDIYQYIAGFGMIMRPENSPGEVFLPGAV